MNGASIIVTQQAGEATVKLATKSPAVQGASTLTAANSANFIRSVAMPRGLTLYHLQTNTGLASAVESAAAITSLNSDTNIQYAYPVYVNAKTGFRLFLNDEIVVRLGTKDALHDTNFAPTFKLKLVDTLNASDNIYVFKLSDPKNFNPFKVCDAIRGLTNVLWVEPNFAQEGRTLAIPNDTQFSDQWHLRNTGQTGAFSDADVDADGAWGGSQGYGSTGIRIAVIDDGVQTTHPDLSANVVQGYDFYSDDSDPNPDGTYNNHGTAVAGLAAAAVNNSLGVAGVAGKSQILPVRLLNTFDAQGHAYLPNSATIYRALLYAADNADIINCSWETSPDSMISDGFSYASGSGAGSGSGRGGYGCPVFCASGNSAGGKADASGDNSYGTKWQVDLFNQFGEGSYYIAFGYLKDASGSANDDCFWIADVTMPDGTFRRFDAATLPSDWTTDGDAAWTGSMDPMHAHGTSRYAWRSGAIANSQFSRLRTVSPVTINSDQKSIFYRAWVSTEAQHDIAYVLIYNSQGNLLTPQFLVGKGSGAVANRTTAVTYPASLSSVLAVGATSDFDYRAHFSQYDSTLDFVAPGGGGYGGIVTTDRTGSDGYASGDYDTGFSGTSASAPIAAGIAALVLSKDGKQWASTVATKLESTCDKVGAVSYSGSPYSRNDYYGYGRLNAYAAVSAVTADTTSPTFVSATVINHRAVDVAFSEPMGEGSLDADNYSITENTGDLSSHPDKVIRIGNVLAGYNNRRGTYRLIWNSGEMATSDTVTITADSSIKDVAGNSVSGTLSKSGTGTKRQIAINCGSPDSFSYEPTFLSDNGFQGNEAAPFLTSSDSYLQTDATYVDTSGVSDPAPQSVYQSQREILSDYEGQTITYDIPDMPSSYNIVRIHLTNITDIYQYEVFNIYINGTYKGTHYGGGTPYQAVVYEYSGIGLDQNDMIEVKIVPQYSEYGDYHAAISGIEVLQP